MYTNCLTVNMLFYQLIIDDCGVPVLKCIIVACFSSAHREYTSRFNSEETLLFCMRVMVGVIILYDHVHPNGAFNKSSKIDVRLHSHFLNQPKLFLNEFKMTFFPIM